MDRVKESKNRTRWKKKFFADVEKWHRKNRAEMETGSYVGAREGALFGQINSRAT